MVEKPKHPILEKMWSGTDPAEVCMYTDLQRELSHCNKRLEEKGNRVQTTIQDAVKLTGDIKDHALSFGADRVGVSEVNPTYVF